MKTKLLLIVFSLIASAGTVFASYDEYDDITKEYYLDNLTYTLNDTNQTAVVTSSDDYLVSINIHPKVTYNSVTYRVIGIGEKACSGHDYISVVIPNSVTYIGNYAFSNCFNLKYIEIPNSVTDIGNGAFEMCYGLTSIDIPNSVTSIGDYAFYNCSSLTSIEIPNSVTSIGDWAFSNCSSLPVVDNIRYADTYLVEAVDKSLSTYNIKQGTKFIGTSAFYDCSLTSIEIPNSVTSIGEYAFEGCRIVTSIDIPNSVKTIGTSAFELCKLSHITIGEGLEKADSAFSSCQIDTVYWNAIHYDDSCTFSFYKSTFIDASYFNTIIFGNKVEHIPAGLCSLGHNNKLTPVTIPTNVKSIGEYSFAGQDIIIPSNNNLRYLYESALSGCNIKSINLPNIERIEARAFSKCENLEQITFGNTLKYLGREAFLSDTSLIAVNLPESLDTIENRCFAECKNLKTATLSEGLKSIGEEAFIYCGITSMNVPNSVRSIGIRAFAHHGVCNPDSDDDCKSTSLKTLTIGENVHEIGFDIIGDCDSLTKIIWNAKKIDGICEIILRRDTVLEDEGGGITWYFAYSDSMQIDTIVFGDNVEHIPAYLCAHAAFWNLQSLTFPKKLKSIGEYAFSALFDVWPLWPDSYNSRINPIKELTIPNEVEYIGKYAFYCCNSLKSLILGESIKEIGVNAFPLYYKEDYNFIEHPVLETIVCYAKNVPHWESPLNEYSDVNRFEKYMAGVKCYVPQESLDLYKADPFWKYFNLQPISAINTQIDTENVSVQTTETTATISFPEVANAQTYELTIYLDGNTIAGYVFDENGLLLDFTVRFYLAPSRQNMPQQDQQVQANGFEFTVSCLEQAKKYTYSLTAKGKSGNVINTFNGTFSTSGYIDTGINDIIFNEKNASVKKIIKDGQILIIAPNEKIYNVNGIEQ